MLAHCRRGTAGAGALAGPSQPEQRRASSVVLESHPVQGPFTSSGLLRAWPSGPVMPISRIRFCSCERRQNQDYRTSGLGGAAPPTAPPSDGPTNR